MVIKSPLPLCLLPLPIDTEKFLLFLSLPSCRGIPLLGVLHTVNKKPIFLH